MNCPGARGVLSNGFWHVGFECEPANQFKTEHPNSRGWGPYFEMHLGPRTLDGTLGAYMHHRGWGSQTWKLSSSKFKILTKPFLIPEKSEIGFYSKSKKGSAIRVCSSLEYLVYVSSLEYHPWQKSYRQFKSAFGRGIRLRLRLKINQD